MSVEGVVPLYDALCDDYDRFVNWEDRLACEMPFIEQTLREADARRVIDVACGTGMHAIELARRGYEVVGADLSAPMIERAKENAATLRQALRQAQDDAQDSAAGVEARFIVAGFGELAKKLALSPVEGLALRPDLSEACPEPRRRIEEAVDEPALSRACPERNRRVEGVSGLFDAVLCLGNSLPHVLSAEDLNDALADFAAVLRRGGLLLIQNRNFDAVLARRERFMGPEAHREGDREWLFVRFYDFNPNGTITFNMVVLRRDAEGKWSQQVEATELRPLIYSELIVSLTAAGFTDIACYGDMQGAPFDPDRSPNLVMTARRMA
jgi:glycine/sarcosine N-methyltransferase